MSPMVFATTVDTVQTAAIITLVGAICYLVRRSDRRFSQQHADIQDVILGQYQILKEIHTHTGEIDFLKEKLALFEDRMRKLDV